METSIAFLTFVKKLILICKKTKFYIASMHKKSFIQLASTCRMVSRVSVTTALTQLLGIKKCTCMNSFDKNTHHLKSSYKFCGITVILIQKFPFWFPKENEPCNNLKIACIKIIGIASFQHALYSHKVGSISLKT